MMIEQFLNYLRYERNASPLTVQRYEGALRTFEEFAENLPGHLSLCTADSDVVRDWMMSLLDRGAKPSTVNVGLSALRSFYRFALTRKLVDHDPAHVVEGPKRSKPLPLFVREEEMDRLLDDLEWNNSYKDVCAHTVIMLLYEAGLRRAELAGLNERDVDFSLHQLKVTGKRNKQRIVPFGQEMEQELHHYLEVRNEAFPVRGEALFLGPKGERITTCQVYGAVKEHLSKVSTLKKRSPHVLRHSFATAMLNHGAGLEGIKNLLGHASVATTEIYTHTTFEQLKQVYHKAHPRA